MLLWMDGFDAYGSHNQDLAAALRTSMYVRHPNAKADNRTRSGRGHALRFEQHPYDTGSLIKAFDARGALIVGMAWKTEAINELRNIMEFHHDNQFGTVRKQFGVWMAADGAVSVGWFSDSPTQGTLRHLLATTPPNIMFPGVWHFIEVKITFHDTAGTIQVRIDGQTCISFSGRTKNAGAPALCNMFRTGNYYLEDITNNPVWVDDLYICDTNGTHHNNFLGDCVVHTVLPFSDAGPNQMSVFGGSLQHFAAVSEIPSDGDATYVYSNTLGHTEMFGIDTLPQNILDILAVSVHVRAKKDSAGYGNIKPLVRLDEEVSAGDLVPLTGNYVTWGQIYPLAPDGTVWSKSKVQEMDIGFQIVE